MKLYVITERTYVNEETYEDVLVTAFILRSSAEDYIKEDNQTHMYSIDEFEIQNPGIISDFDAFVK